MPQGNDRGASGHGLHRRDPEILHTGMDQSPATPQQVLHLVGAPLPQHPDRRASVPQQPVPLRTVPHHQQRQAATVKGLHHQIHPLIGHQASQTQVEVFPGLLPVEALHRHRGVNHHTATPPAAPNAPRRKTGVGHQHVHPLGAELIPLAQLVELPADPRPQRSPGQGIPAQIDVHLIPGIAGRAMHIADVELVRRSEHPLGHQVAAAHHQPMTTQVKLFHRQRQQGQVELHPANPPGQPLNKACGDGAPRQPTPWPPGFPIHQGIEPGRQQLIQLPHHRFSTPHCPGAEPFMDQGDRIR